MSYYIQSHETLPTAITRIAKEQRQKAKTALENKEDRHAGIHKARKHFKKLRALARLLRDELGAKAYKKQNVFYRDLGRSLSDLRDATSLLEALELLQDEYGDFVKKQAFDDVKDVLEDERRAVEARHENDDPVQDVLSQLENSENYVTSLSVASDSWDNILDSIKRVYKRGYNGMQESLDTSTPENIHEWRKRTKYLWYHYRLLKKAWNPVYKALAEETHELSNLLGDHRDLTLLQKKIAERSEKMPPKSAQLIHALAMAHQKGLLADAKLLGAKVFAEKPKAFKQRQRAILRHWHKERKDAMADVKTVRLVAA